MLNELENILVDKAEVDELAGGGVGEGKPRKINECCTLLFFLWWAECTSF